MRTRCSEIIDDARRPISDVLNFFWCCTSHQLGPSILYIYTLIYSTHHQYIHYCLQIGITPFFKMTFTTIRIRPVLEWHFNVFNLTHVSLVNLIKSVHGTRFHKGRHRSSTAIVSRAPYTMLEVESPEIRRLHCVTWFSVIQNTK